MSKLSFRARPLEVSKPMPIYMSEELPDLPEYSAINRAVPQMPSGMKKEEESEHHLQRAIVTGLIIPTPEVTHIKDMAIYNRLYPPNYKVPRQLIHMQPFTMKQDIPDYDMDSDDEKWLHIHSKTMDIDALKFEEMMDRLEKNSGHSVVTQSEAKLLLKEDDDLIIAVYDYWLNKRLQTQQSLIPCVKTEPYRGSNSNNNPYLAFRRRTEKMQTRKNRKNDESTYEKMVKLKRDLSRAHTLLELIKKRENTKRELLNLTVEIFEKRYQAEDFSGQMLAEVSALKTPRPAFAPLFTNQYNHGTSWSKPVKDEYLPRKEKRQYKRRKHKSSNANLLMNDMGSIISSGDDDGHIVSPTSPTHDENPFAFRRKRHCNYHAPLTTGFGNWPWTSREEGGIADKKYRFTLTSIATPTPRCVGFARRRLGRGGRVILDRAGPPMDDFWASLDFTIQDNCKEESFITTEKRVDSKLPVTIKPVIDEKNLPVSNPFLDWPHFYPKQPIETELEEEQVQDVLNNSSLSLMVEDLNDPNHEFTPVNLNLSELFPSLVWDSSDQEQIKRESEMELITPLRERDFEYQVLDVSKSVEPIASEISTKSAENDFELLTKNFKHVSIDKKEYQSGSLLDRWARFKSPSTEPVAKPSLPEPFLADDLSGCSLFRISNIWPESKVRTVSESSAPVPAIVEEQSESASAVIEDMSILPLTPPKQNKTPPLSTKIHNLNNTTALINGPVNAYS